MVYALTWREGLIPLLASADGGDQVDHPFLASASAPFPCWRVLVPPALLASAGVILLLASCALMEDWVTK